MRTAIRVGGLLLYALLVFSGGAGGAGTDASGLDPRLEKVLSDLERLGPEKFDPCRAASGRGKPDCEHREFVLWTAFASDAHVRTLEKLAGDKATLGDTPGGELVARELANIDVDWSKKVVVWERLSRAYVRHLLEAQARVVVHVGPDHPQPNPGSVFCRVELPTILESKPGLVVMISSQRGEFAEFVGKRITATNQWPCGRASPVDPVAQILADIDRLGADKFDPCKTPSNRGKPGCKPGAYALWTSFASDEDLRQREQLGPDTVTVGETPAGEVAATELDKTGLEWSKQLVAWEKLSRSYVENMLSKQSRVTVHVGSHARQPNRNSVFCRIELPTILKTKPDQVVMIASRDRAHASYDGMRITAANQWPCGEASPVAMTDAEAPKDGPAYASGDGPFAKSVRPVELGDPAKSWSEVLGKIRADPIIARLASLTVQHLSGSRFSFRSSLDVAGRTLGYSGHLLLNPQARHDELLLKVEASLATGKLALASLEATGAKLDIAVVNESGRGRVYARIRPEIKLRGKRIPAVVGFGAGHAGTDGARYDVDLGRQFSLRELIPAVARLGVLKNAFVGDVKILEDRLHIDGVLGGKRFGLTVGANKLRDFEIVGADLRLSDLIPSAKSLRAFDNFTFGKLAHSQETVSVSGTIDKKPVTVTYASAGGGAFTAQGDGLALADFVPEARGLRAFDRVTLSLVSISAKQFEVDGALAGRKIRFVKRRSGPGGVAVTSADLRASDVFPALKSMPGLDAVAVEKIDLNREFVEVEVLLNGQQVDLVAHADTNGKGGYIAVLVAKLSAATFIPAARGHWINDVELDQALFIIQPQQASPRKIAGSDLPGTLGKQAGLRGGDSLDIRPGLNVSARLNAARSRGLTDMFKALGLKAGSLQLRGTLSAATFRSLAGKSRGRAAAAPAGDRSSLLEGLALSANLPVPALPAVSKFVKVTGPARLSLGGASSDDGIWSRLPKSLSASRPADGLDLSVRFGVRLANAGLNEQLDALVDIGGADHKNLSLLVLSQGQWKSPFGVSALTLKSGGFRFALARGRGPRSGELAFFGVAALGAHPDVEVSADFVDRQGKLALNYFALDGKFSLRDLPGGSRIPHAERFELDEIKLSGRGLEARTILAGKKVDAFLFEQSADNWVFAIDQKDFRFSELLPAISAIKPLERITLSRAALIISENGISGSRRNMPEIAQDLLRDVFGKSNVDVSIPGGIGLLAAFDEKRMGVVGQGLKKIGVHDDAILMGEITGIFQGQPGILLSLTMERAGAAHGIPRKVISVPQGVEPQFFIQWSGAEFYVGAGLGLSVKAGKDRLHVVSKIELDFSEKGIGIDILGEVDGTWHQPFGIKGISLSDVKMKVGINDIGEVSIGFAGRDRIGKEDMSLATEVKILLEDALPDGVAFSATANRLGVPAIIDIAETLMDAKGKISPQAIPFFEIHGAQLAFATPGAADPQLGLMSAGFAVKGQFYFMNRQLGEITGLGSVTNGLTFSGDIADIDLEVLKFRQNKLDMAVNLQPKFLLHSNIELGGSKQVVSLDAKPPHVEFTLIEKLASLGEAELRVRLDGFDLAKGTYNRDADLSVVGAFKSNLVPWMKQEITAGITDLRKSADARLKADLAAVRAAQGRVDRIDEKIRKLRASDNRRKSRATATIDNAEKRVSALRRDHEHAVRESNHCGDRWSHWACSAVWKTRAASVEVVYKAAVGVLEAIKASEAAAFDYDPRLVELMAERDIEHAALTVAQGVLQAAKSANNFVLNRLTHVLTAGLNHLPFEIDQAILVGDLRDMIRRDAPLVLDMKFRMFGTPMREYFAVKIRDPAFDAVSFALLPALAMDRLTESALRSADPAIARWLHSHIGAKLAKAEANVRRQVDAEEKRYAGLLKSFETGGAKFRKAYGDQAGQHLAAVSRTQVSDLFGNSGTFRNTYLAVGHSSLCLGVAANGTDVIQEDCKDVEADRWSTRPVADGYVQLLNKGLCLKARNASKAEQNPLMLAACNRQDLHEEWKVISSDGFYDKIVNRYSQKCLHFDNENANPKTARAVWTSCMGADSQTFRDLKDAEKPTWHGARAMLKARNGNCLSLLGGSGSRARAELLRQKLATGKLTHHQYDRMRHEGENALVAESCDPSEDRFNYLEQVNGDITLVHEKTGWCVRPGTARDSGVFLAPCDRGKDMTWRLDRSKGNAWMLKNVTERRCLSLPARTRSQPDRRQARMAKCVPDSTQLLDFVGTGG